MTTAMAEERRDQLERYLQNVTADPRVTRSDVFTEFLTLVQLHTLNISIQNVELAVFLPDGRSIKVEGLTSDTAERVLEVMAHKLGLQPDLVGYFGLFLIRCFPEGKLSVVKKLADFELPYTSLQSSEMENCKIGLRKWYLDPALDSMLMDCRAAGDLLYMQAVQDIEKEWMKPTQAQREELKALQKKENQTKGTLLDTDGPQRTLNQNLELRFQYSEDSCQQWFVIYTKQAFFLSSCLKKMISERMTKLTEQSPEMQIEVPEQGRSKKHLSQPSQQKVYFNFLRKGKMKRSEGDYVWDTLMEEGL